MTDWAERKDRPERRRFHPRFSLVCVVRAAVVTLLTAALIVGYVASAHARDGWQGDQVKGTPR